ncbi:MAG: bifunctional DNA primase/polymerase [Armatimonadota bacterium]|nr:bifunctional DNA primase/polymerase [Armatimonadota bacterium]
MSGAFASDAPAYHAHGLNIVPVVPGTKRSAVAWSRWQHERQTAAEVGELAREYPDGDIAVILGGPGLSLGDLDHDGPAAVASVRAERLPLPPTAAFEARRGHHLLYRTTGPLPRTAMLPDLEFLGSGLLVVPRSAGRHWLLDLDHLTDLPRAWLDRVAATRDTLHNVNTTTTAARYAYAYLAAPRLSGSEELGGCPVGGVWPAAARLLGLPDELGRGFRCPLPGHEERRASAAWWAGENGVIVLVDFHRRDGEEAHGGSGRPPVYTVPEVFASIRAGRTLKLPGTSHAVWAARLQVELGLLRPPVVPLRFPASVGAPVSEMVRLLFGIHWLREPGKPVPLSWRFVSAWCRIDERAAGALVCTLLAAGTIRFVGKHRGISLFLPGAGELGRVRPE